MYDLTDADRKAVAEFRFPGAPDESLSEMSKERLEILVMSRYKSDAMNFRGADFQTARIRIMRQLNQLATFALNCTDSRALRSLEHAIEPALEQAKLDIIQSTGPFKGETVAEAMENICSERLTDIRVIQSDDPKSLAWRKEMESPGDWTL